VAVVWGRHGSSSREARAAAAAAADMGAEGLLWGGKANGPPGLTSAVLGVFGKLSRASAYPAARPHGRTESHRDGHVFLG